LVGENLPLLFAKKEVFVWLKEGKKTIDVRKGVPRMGDTAIFQSGSFLLSRKILKKETGQLGEVVRADNFQQIIPSAFVLGDAIAYLHGLYGDYDGVFTAYYLSAE
jgi:ASC-1-like (ASCH) protein